MTTKQAIIAASKFNPLNYSEVIRTSFTEVMHRAIPYKCIHAFDKYITGFQFDYVFDTQEELDAFIVSVPESITKLQASRYLRHIGRYNELMQALDSDPTGNARIDYNDSNKLDRTDPMVLQIGYALSMDSDAIDDFFVSAEAFQKPIIT